MAEALTNKSKHDMRVYVYQTGSTIETPSLVLRNLSEAKSLRDFLTRLIRSHKDYFKNIGGISET